jgi:hypothetical protein
MKFVFHLVLLTSSISSLQGQELRPVKMRAICFQHVGVIKKLVAVTVGEKSSAVEFPLYTTAICNEIDTFASDGILNFAMEDGLLDGKPKFKTITTAKAVPGPRQLVIFTPGGSADSPYRCFVVDDSLESFPMGSTLAVNLSAAAFQFAIGEHVVVVNPGKIEKIPMAKKANDRGQVSVVISVASPQDNSAWRAVNQTRWFNGTDKRDLAIGFIHPKTQLPTVNCYADTPAGVTHQRGLAVPTVNVKPQF